MELASDRCIVWMLTRPCQPGIPGEDVRAAGLKGISETDHLLDGVGSVKRSSDTGLLPAKAVKQDDGGAWWPRSH
ncbi:MAG TPA: hypothetical protein DCE39_01610 [Planctomycetaceae bacterium]|nr:hypothetical protein [Planctomycetaceae bacterium]